MADVVDVATRSLMMSGIRGANTHPEMKVKSILHRLGFRFRIHQRNMAGTPDIVLPRFRAVVFVNGCFSHGHQCHLFKWPASRTDFWRAKIGRNVENDSKAIAALRVAGWRTGTIWECAMKGRTRLDDETIGSLLADWLRNGQTQIEFIGTERSKK